jgi:hypothetical protein
MTPAVVSAGTSAVVDWRVIRGSPTPEELAALVVVLATVTAPTPPAPAPRTLWGQPSQHHRRALR